MSKPFVHVLIPYHNAAPYIEKTLDSVTAQDYPHVRVFLYNDGSSDDTERRIQDYKEKRDNPEFHFSGQTENGGVVHARNRLVEASRRVDPDAYFLWLDADDYFTDNRFLSRVAERMDRTGADICLFNLDVSYEHPDLVANAAGLLKDREKSQAILDTLQTYPDATASLSDYPEIGTFTSLNCTKVYGPSVVWPHTDAAGPFADFVYMAAFFSARKITGFEGDYKPYMYFRRSQSLTGKRTPATFAKVLERLQEFKSNLNTDNPLQTQVAEQFIHNKIGQYRLVLESLIESGSNPELTPEVLDRYNRDALLFKPASL